MTYLAFSVILLISFLTLLPSFSLIIYGDTWLSFFRYLQHLGPESSGQYNYLTFLLTPYGAQEILMGILQKIFGYEPIPYFVISYILRMVAAFSFYPLVYYLTRSKPATFFAILFFSITTIGLDTTDWVFNMTSYITIAFFNLFLFQFLKNREDNKIRSLFLACLLYLFAYIVAPVRMHGSLPFIFFLEVFWILQKADLKTFKKAFVRFFYILMVFLLIRFSGQSLGPSTEIMQRLTVGIQTTVQLLTQGKLDFLFYPIVMFGGMIIPDFVLSQTSRFFILLFTGGLIFLCVIFLIVKFFKKDYISTCLYLGLSWSILSFFFAWWWMPTTIFPTTYRYLIVSAAGIAILFSSIIALGKDKKQQRLLFTLFSLIIALHVVSTQTYINYLTRSHGRNINNKIWSSITRVPDIGKSQEATIFYFEGDLNTGPIIHDVITFGFPPHMALLYNLREEDGNFPISTNNWQEVVTAIQEGKIQPMYGPTIPTNIARIYAFYLSENGNLIDITAKARERLKQIKTGSKQ